MHLWRGCAIILTQVQKDGPLPHMRGMNVCLQIRKGSILMDLVKALSDQYLKPELPTMNVGDTVRVTVRVKEGNRERNQAFEGTIIAKKHGGINETITVRRISYNVGCEKVFPVHSPSIVSVETVRRGKVRRAKLYYLRDKVGKKAKVKERI